MGKGINVLSLFDGMSCGQVALERASIKVENYYASEINKYASEIASKNYPRTLNLGDVCEIRTGNGRFGSNGLSFKNNINLLIGGSPCQDLSGLKPKGSGLDGEKSRLFFEYVRLKEELNPEYFLLENVVPRKKEWKEQIDEILGVEGILINSDLFVPQNRPRYYWTNIPIYPLPTRPDWNQKYYQWRRTYFRENMSGVCPCLTANMGTGGHNVPLKSKDLKDKLSPVECELLQGLIQNYTEGVSNSRRYEMIGNGWTIDVIEHIFKGLHKSL